MRRSTKNQNSQDSSLNELRITYSQIAVIIGILASLFSGIMWVAQAYSEYKDTVKTTASNEGSIKELKSEVDHLTKDLDQHKSEAKLTVKELRFYLDRDDPKVNKYMDRDGR